jgi:hypothetical protein
VDDGTYMSWAVTDAEGFVVCTDPWAIAQPGDAQSNADTATCFADPGQTVHVWLGGGVDLWRGQDLVGLRAADATAVAA